MVEALPPSCFILQGGYLHSLKTTMEDYANFTNLTFDNGPNVSLNNESEHEPRNESSRSIFG